MTDHVCEWKLRVHLNCPDAPEVEPYCIHDTGGPTTCHISEDEIERRLNATEVLSAEGARVIANVFPVDELIEYADILEGKDD